MTIRPPSSASKRKAKLYSMRNTARRANGTYAICVVSYTFAIQLATTLKNKASATRRSIFVGRGKQLGVFTLFHLVHYFKRSLFDKISDKY